MGAIYFLYLRRLSAPGGVWLAYQSGRVCNLLHAGLDNVSLADCLQCESLTCKQRSLASMAKQITACYARLGIFLGVLFSFRVISFWFMRSITEKPSPVQPVFWCSHNSTAPKPPQPNKPMRLSSLLLILVRFSAKPRLDMGQ